MNSKIDELVTEAIDILNRNWDRCDEETGDECKLEDCGYPEHQVMALLCKISDENKK